MIETNNKDPRNYARVKKEWVVFSEWVDGTHIHHTADDWEEAKKVAVYFIGENATWVGKNKAFGIYGDVVFIAKTDEAFPNLFSF